MKSLIYILFLGIGIFLTSCEDAGLDKLFDEDFIELDAATTVTGARTYSYLRQNDGQGVPSGFMVSLGARQKSSPVNFTFSIDPSSTAIENLHYTVQGTSGTIPANQSLAELPITILDDNINVGEVLSIVVKLTGADITVHPEYDQATHNIQVSCPSDLGGTYDSVADGGVGDGSGGQASAYSGLATTVVLTDLGGGRYQIDDMSFGLYPIGYGDTAPSGIIEEVCGTISDTGSTDQYQDPFTITGTVGAGGVITLTWSNTWGDLGNVTLTPK